MRVRQVYVRLNLFLASSHPGLLLQALALAVAARHRLGRARGGLNYYYYNNTLRHYYHTSTRLLRYYYYYATAVILRRL